MVWVCVVRSLALLGCMVVGFVFAIIFVVSLLCGGCVVFNGFAMGC